MFATADETSEAEFEEAVLRAEKAIGRDGQIEQLTREFEFIRTGDVLIHRTTVLATNLVRFGRREE